MEGKLETTAKEIHWYISYGILSMYHMMMNTITNEPNSKKHKIAQESVERLLNLSECLYDELQPGQKELMEVLAKNFLEKIADNPD